MSIILQHKASLGVQRNTIEPERCPQVVFVTAYDKYMQRAFEVHALDYLRKPFTDERFYFNRWRQKSAR